MSRICCFFTTFMILAAAPGHAQRIPMKNPVGLIQRMHQRTITRGLTSELALMKITMRLNDDQVASFRQAAQHAINLEAKRLADANATRAGTGQDELPKSVRDILLKKATQRVGKFRVDAYLKDKETRKEFLEQAGVDGFLVALDQSLMLSESQVAKFERLLMKHWKAGWTELGMNAGETGLLTLQYALSSLPEQDVRDILTRPQWEALQGARRTAFRTLMVRTEQVDIETQKRDFIARQTEHCKNIGKLKVDEFARLNSLDKAHRNASQAVMDKVVSSIVQNQTDAFVSMKKQGPANTDEATMSFLTEHASDQIDRHPKWSVTAGSDAWKARQAARATLRRQQSANSIVGNLSQQFGFTGKQQQSLSRLLLDASDERKGEEDNMQTVLLRIEDSKLTKLFEEGQWLRLRQTLDARRERLGIQR